MMMEAASVHLTGFFAFARAIAATIHARNATAVLLSVRSVPNGQPVHHALKAYHCINGPRINPPTKRDPSVQYVSFFSFGSLLKISRPARIENNIAMNIART